MASHTKANLADLEKLRLTLENNIASLRKSLKHWQSWEAEYEGLKEEIGRLGDDASQEQMLRVGKDFEGELVNEKDIQANVKTVQKELYAAETKLERALMISLPVVGDEDGLPMAEIHEELDEDGNVISSTVRHPAESAASIVDALGKAGLKEEDLEEPSTVRQLEGSTDLSASATLQTASMIVDSASPESIKSSRDESELAQRVRGSSAEIPKPRKKSVTFAEDTKPEKSALENGQQTGNSGRYGSASSLAEFVKGTFTEGNRVLELNDDFEVVNTAPVIPTDESQQDAALRREMLQYSLPEVGSIVAQIDLDERESQGSDSNEDYMHVDELGSTSSAEEEEDEHGMSRSVRVKDAYRAEMLALEKKLNARSMQNIGPPSSLNGDLDMAEEESALTKGVRFAENIDIVPPTSSSQNPVANSQKAETQMPTMKEAVSERNNALSTNTTTTERAPKNAARVSRFKASRAKPTPQPGPSHTESSEILFPDDEQSASNTTKTPPPPPTILSNITERTLSTPHQSPAPPTPVHSQVQPDKPSSKDGPEDPYEGAYEDDTADGLDVEMEGFPQRKISLFKAARLRAARSQSSRP